MKTFFQSLLIVNKKLNGFKSIPVLFRYRNLLGTKLKFIQNLSSPNMPPKKSNTKRKATSDNAVSDPFSASKKVKKEEKEEFKESNKSPEKFEKDCEIIDKIEKKAEKIQTQSKLSKFIVKKDSKKEDTEENEENEQGQNDDSTSTKYNKEEFKRTTDDKEWNFKIVSWNINGIRAWIEKGGLDYIKAEDPDIFCCQETKCDKSKIPPKAELPNYHCYWLSGDSQGYSGVGLITKIKPIKVSYGINDKNHDSEGRAIVAEYENFILINTYIPNSGRGLVRLKYRMEWEEVFRKFLKELDQTKPIIWAGDLNVAHTEIDLKNPTTNTKTAGFTKEERACFTNLLSDGYIDSFRYLYPKQTGAYTFWSYLRNSRSSNAGWRLDYFVLSQRLKENLVDNMIRSQVLGSDHCPVCLFLKFPNKQ